VQKYSASRDISVQKYSAIGDISVYKIVSQYGYFGIQNSQPVGIFQYTK
jgi:hypothetical protein